MLEEQQPDAGWVGAERDWRGDALRAVNYLGRGVGRSAHAGLQGLEPEAKKKRCMHFDWTEGH